MAAENPLAQMKIWFDKPKYDMAEKKYYERLAKVSFVLKFIWNYWLRVEHMNNPNFLFIFMRNLLVIFYF